MAANESQQKRKGKDEATPEELLAELSELRRAWQLAQAERDRLAREGQRGRGAGPGENDPNNPELSRLARNGQPGRDGERAANGERDPNGPRDPNGQRDGQGQRGPGDAQGQEGQPGSEGQQGGAEGGGDSQGGGQQGGAQNGGRFADNGTYGDPESGGGARNWGGPADGWRGGYSGHFIEGDRGRWDNWNPPLPTTALRPVDPEEFRRQAEAFARRFRELANRMPEGALPDTEIDKLRQLANRLRSANGRDPMESEYARMVGLVDQLELAALNASEKNRTTAATRASRPVEDAPEYRETVAEYYRRLGDGNKDSGK